MPVRQVREVHEAFPDATAGTLGPRSIGELTARALLQSRRASVADRQRRCVPRDAGAAGGYALLTTAGDLARFLDALFAGRLFRHRATLKQMLTIAPAQGEGGLVGYGLGIERRALPGGAELIGHLGGAVYRSYVGRLHPTNATLSLVMNTEDDPTPLLLPAIKALTATNP